jgi:hypothetical protein
MSPPSSSPPAGVPGTSNNAKYAIVAVLLIVGIGAMVVLRNFSSKANAPAPLPAASVPLSPTPPANPRLEDIPPPPPPEDSAETKKTGPRIVYVQAAGCDAKCVGQPSPDLGPALQVRAAQARRCYNSALAQDSSLKGKVTIAVRIGPSGNVCGFERHGLSECRQLCCKYLSGERRISLTPRRLRRSDRADELRPARPIGRRRHVRPAPAHGVLCPAMPGRRGRVRLRAEQ